MQCPACKNVNLIMTDRQGVEIDYCPECRGVWLDRGELDKIIERTASFVDPHAGERRDDRDDYKQQYKYHRKKKGFLGEFFDFD